MKGEERPFIKASLVRSARYSSAVTAPKVHFQRLRIRCNGLTWLLVTTHEKVPGIHIVLFLYVGGFERGNDLFKGFIFFNKWVDGW